MQKDVILAVYLSPFTFFISFKAQDSLTEVVHQCPPAFVFQWDVTGAGIYLYTFLIVVLSFGFLATTVTLTTGSFVMTVVYAGLLALVFSMVSHTLRVFDASVPCSPPFLSPLIGMVGLFLFLFFCYFLSCLTFTSALVLYSELLVVVLTGRIYAFIILQEIKI